MILTWATMEERFLQEQLTHQHNSKLLRNVAVNDIRRIEHIPLDLILDDHDDANLRPITEDIENGEITLVMSSSSKVLCQGRSLQEHLQVLRRKKSRVNNRKMPSTKDIAKQLYCFGTFETDHHLSECDDALQNVTGIKRVVDANTLQPS